jgi:serine/threonine-protein kinase
VTAEGQTLAGRYRLEERLGRGGSATVWRARDLDLGRQVAVKVLDGSSAELGSLSRFRREGELLARLSHPNLVPVFGSGVDGDTPFLVMELVDGRTLRSLLDEGPLPEADGVRITADIAAGLGVAHAAGIVHRDVTPANIVLGHDGVPRLVDFGIARAADLTALTQTATVLGTAAYLSPEQARGEAVTPASDVYALGCVLFELLTGHPPFPADSAVAVAYRHVHDHAPSLAGEPEVTPAVAAVVAHCLDKSAARRPADATVLAAELHAAQRGELPALDTSATVAMPALASATAVLPVTTDTATGVGGAPLLARRLRLPVALATAATAILLLVVALVAGGSDGGGKAGATTTSTSSTAPTTVAPPPTTAAPVVAPPAGKAKGKHKNDD